MPNRNIFDFWRGCPDDATVHPADANVFDRVESRFKRGCLPIAYSGPLRTAPGTVAVEDVQQTVCIDLPGLNRDQIAAAAEAFGVCVPVLLRHEHVLEGCQEALVRGRRGHAGGSSRSLDHGDVVAGDASPLDVRDGLLSGAFRVEEGGKRATAPSCSG